MAEPFKNLIDAALVRRTAAHLARAWPAFDAERFVALATRDLQALELKARAIRIAEALQATLPEDFGAAAVVIERALAPASDSERLDEVHRDDDGLAGWALWGVGEFVARQGLGEPERALATLRELTQRFSAEFAIRPFIAAHPGIAFATLARWVDDPNLHVRRLVSEGSRPRLPWGMRLAALVVDPSPSLPLLAALQDDASEYVRRSVANHLNDIAKDHPALVVQWLRQHLPGASVQRRALLRHASRTLIKQGHGGALAAWGLDAAFRGEARLALRPKRIELGQAVELELRLQSRARTAQRLAVDYVVHHVKARGGTSPKVFKGWVLELPPAGAVDLRKTHSMKPVTTRRYHAGRHDVTVQVNGREVAAAHFTLRMRGPQR